MSMPYGNIEAPVKPDGAGRRSHFRRPRLQRRAEDLTELIKAGIQHKGFSFVDVFSPCVTYNQNNTYQWFKPRVKKLEDDPNYDADWSAAMGKAQLGDDEIPIGKFFQRTDLPSLHGAEPILADDVSMVQRDLRVPVQVARGFIEELM